MHTIILGVCLEWVLCWVFLFLFSFAHGLFLFGRWVCLFFALKTKHCCIINVITKLLVNIRIMGTTVKMERRCLETLPSSAHAD